MSKKYVIGIDYGSDSVRSLIVDTSNGNEIANAVFEYPRWKEGKYCDPVNSQFRQHPLDYLEGIEHTVTEALMTCSAEVTANIVAISIDTTGSTPVAVNKEGIPLSLLPGFKENPNAMFVLWKDHTAVKEADEINKLAISWGGENYTKYEGGIYSPEWFWAKALHIMREDKKVREAVFSWVEHCDWLPGLLVGNTNPLELKRSRCAAGHKAMWHESWNGLPSENFLVRLDPLLKGLRNNLFTETYTIDQSIGTLSEEWAEKLGLSTKVSIGVGAIDAHLGAVGTGIKPYYLSKVMGTSTCDMLVVDKKDIGDKLIQGISGQVDGSITPGLIGLEAGQAAFGDIYAWFKDILMWPLNNVLGETGLLDNATRDKLIEEVSDKLIAQLSEEALKVPIEESGIVALDWMNGRRTPDSNPMVKGAITGLTLGSDAPRIFKSLVEATAFGTKKIIERFIKEGVRIDGVIALGGVAKKSKLVMQTVSDVLNMPIKVAKSEQACALGSAMAAAVSGGIYANIEEAQNKMGSGFEMEFIPNTHNAIKYEALYKKYSDLGVFVEGRM